MRRHSPKSRATILCVDDNPVLLSLRQIILRQAGYQVFVSTSGPKALVIAKTRRVDLALVDYDMPDMNGFVIAALLRWIQPTTKIVIVSAHDSKAPRGFGELDGFIAKGVPVPKFLKQVEHYLTIKVD